MGVSNVYNQAKSNAIAAIKSNLTAKGTKKAVIPEHLKMTGSVFDAPGVRDNKPAATLANLNTTASLADLNKKPVEGAQGKGSNSKNPDSFADIDNVADGKAAANSVSAQGDKVKAYTAKTEQQAGVVARLGSHSAKLDGQIAEANKKFTLENRQLELKIKADNKALQNLIEENINNQKEVDDAQNELNTLLARNSFSMGGSSASGSSDDAGKINELQTFIGSKVGVMQANGKVVYSLQRSQNRTLSRMQRTNSQYIKTHQRNIKALQNSQAEDSKIIKVATEVEKYSALAQAGGQMLSLAGRGLVALGAAMQGTVFGSAVGAALIATGQVMGKIGTVVELVGQYGQTAANLTKTAAYAAEGNIMGAMQSAASAVQMGTAAVKGTTGLKAQFKAIDQTATEATNKLAAKTIANETIQGDVGGMTKKEARKAMAANLEAQFNSADSIGGVTSTHNQNGRLNQLRKAAQDGTTITTTKTVNGKETTTSTTFNAGELATKTLEQTKTDFTKEYNTSITKAGGETKLSDKDKEKIRKKAAKQTRTSYKNTSSSTKSSTNWADNMNKFTQTMTSFAQMYMMFNGGGSMMGMMGSSMPSMNNMMRFGNSMMGMGNMRYVNNGMGYAGNTSHSTRKRQNPYATRHLTRSARA